MAFFASLFSGGGPAADLFSVAVAVVLFALLYFSIDLIDRI